MPRDAFVLKVQRELCYPKYARKVSGLSRNRPLEGLLSSRTRTNTVSPLTQTWAWNELYHDRTGLWLHIPGISELKEEVVVFHLGLSVSVFFVTKLQTIRGSFSRVYFNSSPRFVTSPWERRWNVVRTVQHVVACYLNLTFLFISSIFTFTATGRGTPARWGCHRSRFLGRHCEAPRVWKTMRSTWMAKQLGTWHRLLYLFICNYPQVVVLRICFLLCFILFYTTAFHLLFFISVLVGCVYSVSAFLKDPTSIKT